MYNNFIILAVGTISVGILYGILFHLGKKHLLSQNKPYLDLLFTLARFILLFFVIYYMFYFIAPNSILMTILFVSSYLSTVAVLTYNS